MSGNRAVQNIGRMRDMRITRDEYQWIVGYLAGTVMMTAALDALTERRASGAMDNLTGTYSGT